MKHLNLKTLLTYLSLALLGLYMPFMAKSYEIASHMSKNFIFETPGSRFVDARPYIKEAPIVGYLTNKDTSAENNDGEFLAAQFVLAPTVLDLNNSNHDLVILDYTNIVDLYNTIAAINAEIIYKNRLGVVIAKKNK